MTVSYLTTRRLPGLSYTTPVDAALFARLRHGRYASNRTGRLPPWAPGYLFLARLLLAAGHPDNTVCGPRGKTSERLPCRCRP